MLKKIIAVFAAVALLAMGGCAQLVPAAFPVTQPQAQAQVVQPATVLSVRTVVQQAQPSAGGAIVGALLGGVLGHQVGKGRGNTVATVLGALTGGAIGSQAGATEKPTTTVVVQVLGTGEEVQLVGPAIASVYVGQPVYLIRGQAGNMSLVARQG